MSKSKKKDDLTSSLKSLVDTLEKSSQEHLVQGPALKIVDLTVPYSYMWSPAAKLGMSKKLSNLIYRREIKVIKDLQTEVLDRVHYFAAIAVGEEKIVKAARVLTHDINELARMGYVTGCLAPLSYIHLATEPFQLSEYVVFCYVSLTPEGTEWLDKQACGSHMKKEGDLTCVLRFT